MIRRAARLASFGAWLAGLALVVAGLAQPGTAGLPFDPKAIAGLVGIGGGPEPTSGQTTAMALPSPDASPPDASPPRASTTPEPKPTARPSATPGTALVTLFADTFRVIDAWPLSEDPAAAVRGRVSAGRLLLSIQATDLPVYVVPVSGEGRVRRVMRATATLSPPRAGSAGVAVTLENGGHLVLLVSATGRASLYLDTVESLDLLASSRLGSLGAGTSIELQITPTGARATIGGGGGATLTAVGAWRPTGLAIAVWGEGAGSAAFDQVTLQGSAD